MNLNGLNLMNQAEPTEYYFVMFQMLCVCESPVSMQSVLKTVKKKILLSTCKIYRCLIYHHSEEKRHHKGPGKTTVTFCHG